MTDIDFASVQWARKIADSLTLFGELPADDLKKLGQLMQELSHLKAEGHVPTPAQMTVILQYLHTKNLDLLEAVKGGLMVHFSGGGLEYERFLLRADGRIPNHKYESKAAAQ